MSLAANRRVYTSSNEKLMLYCAYENTTIDKTNITTGKITSKILALPFVRRVASETF